MFKLMGKKIITILAQKVSLPGPMHDDWFYIFVRIERVYGNTNKMPCAQFELSLCCGALSD